MASLNSARIIGYVGQDPEVRYTQGGQAVSNFSVATSEKWKDRDGKIQERTEWHRIVVWGKQAESCAEYLRKGRQVYVDGRIQTREWEDKDDNKRYTTEIVAMRVLFLGKDGSDSSGGQQPQQRGGGGFRQQRGGRGRDQGPPPDDSDIPF